MANPKAVRDRIVSIAKIKKIANALEIVALTRLRHMEQKAVASRDYFDRIRELLFDVAGNINIKTHPLFGGRSVKAVGIISIFSDKGLCGSFNANVAHKFLQFMGDLGDKKIKAGVIGKKGSRYIKSDKKCEILSTDASNASGVFIDAFLKAEVDEVFLLYSKFRLHLLGEARIIKLLPFTLGAEESKNKRPNMRDYIYEPTPRDVFKGLVTEYIANQIQHGILESRCAEEMSRMLAMKSASDNADEAIGKLNLQYNKARQARITEELAEVVSAAEATV